MAGNPRDRAAVPRTVLEHVLWEEQHTYEEIAAKFERVASELGEHTSITARHLRRLASGSRSGTTPVTRRVLQAMFGQPVERLLSPWSQPQPNPPPPEAAATFGSDEGLSWSDRQALDEATRRARGFLVNLSSTNVNGETMDQLYDDVASLAVSYQRESPSVIAGRLIDRQAQVFDLLEGRQPPHHTRQLLPTEAPEAESYAEAAVTAYADRDATHWAFGDAAGSAADLAVARLQRGHIDGASEALVPVLELPASQRINGIVASVDRVYATLRAGPRSPAASQLQEQIETFKARPLRALPNGC